MTKARRQGVRRILPARTRTQILKKLRLFAVDVDGVLTDGGMYYGESGEEMKKFNTRDGMGLKLLQAEGFITAFITRENTKLVASRGEKLGIPEIHQGVHDKLSMLQKIATKYHLDLQQAAYMGDDVNDVEVLKAAGFSGAPADCMEPVKQVVHYVCRLKGGEGAVREVVDLILAARGAQPLFK